MCSSDLDSILARLSDGEYVVRAAAVRAYGARFLDSVNHLRVPRFAEGGAVGGGGGGGGAPIHLHLDGKQYGPMSASEGVVDALRDAIAKQALKMGSRR